MAPNKSGFPGWPEKPPSQRVDEQPPPKFEPPTPSYQPPPAEQSYQPQSHQPQSYQPPAPHAQTPPPPHPHPPGQPPSYPSGSTTPPTKTTNVVATIGVIVAILLLGVGACTVWFVDTLKAPVDESNRFLAAVDEGDYSGALAIMGSPTCADSPLTIDTFEQTFGGADITYNLNSSSITNSEATVSGSFSTTADSPVADARSIEVFLRDRDGWEVCGFRTR